MALNPRTGEPVKEKADKTVRFKVSPTLKKFVQRPRHKRHRDTPAGAACKGVTYG